MFKSEHWKTSVADKKNIAVLWAHTQHDFYFEYSQYRDRNYNIIFISSYHDLQKLYGIAIAGIIIADAAFDWFASSLIDEFNMITSSRMRYQDNSVVVNYIGKPVKQIRPLPFGCSDRYFREIGNWAYTKDGCVYTEGI
jgi:hypothetical protein